MSDAVSALEMEGGAEAAPAEAAPLDRGDARGAVARARAAQAAWSLRPIAERVRAVAKVKRKLLERAEEIGGLLERECGKPSTEGILSEVVPTADVFDYWVRTIEEHLAPVEVELSRVVYPGKTGRTFRAPRGVVALITPSNYPVAIPLRTIVPALLAGNVVVWKPSEITQRCADIVARAFEGILPPDVLVVVHGAADVGAALIGAGVDLVVFTGSPASGRKVLAACAEDLVPASVELGGKDAAIVLADAKIERAARGIVWGAFTNAGQNCASIERVYVERSIADELCGRIVALVKELQPERDIGRLATDAQAAIVRAHVEQAIEKGAEVLVGGLPDADAKPRAFPPTVLKINDEDIDVLRTETFGPVLPIVVVDGADAAVERVRANRYGLTTSVWTRSPERVSRLVDVLPTPIVTFNCHGITAAIPEAPWGGQGESGFGVTNGVFALAELTRPRFVLEDRSLASRELYWYPYTPALRALALAMAKLRGGASIFGRVPAFFSFVAAFMKRIFEK